MEAVRCPLCGSGNEPGSRFCGDCGNPLTASGVLPAPGAGAAAGPGGTGPLPPPPDGAAARPERAPARPRPRWQAAVAVVAVAVLGAVALVLHLGGSNRAAGTAGTAGWRAAGGGTLAAPADWLAAVPVPGGDDLAAVEASATGYALTLLDWQGSQLAPARSVVGTGQVTALAGGAGAGASGEIGLLTAARLDLFSAPGLQRQDVPNPGIQPQSLLLGAFGGEAGGVLGAVSQPTSNFTGYVLFTPGPGALVARDSVQVPSPLSPLFAGPSSGGVPLALYNWYDAGQGLSGVSLLDWSATRGLVAVTTLPLPFEEDRTVTALSVGGRPEVAVTGEGPQGAVVTLYALQAGQLVPAGSFPSPFGTVPPLVVGGRFGGRDAIVLVDHVTRERYVRMVAPG